MLTLMDSEGSTVDAKVFAATIEADTAESRSLQAMEVGKIYTVSNFYVNACNEVWTDARKKDLSLTKNTRVM